MHETKRGAVAPVLMTGLLFAGILACGGCSSATRKPAPTMRTAAPVEMEHNFDAGAGRAPTAKTLYRMAELLSSQGKESQAEAVLQGAIRRYPNFTPAYCELAALQVRQQRTMAAVETLGGALQVAPEDPILHNDVGMCWMLMGQYDSALASFSKASARSPVDARYRANMALATGMLGNYEEALTLYQEVLTPERAYHNLNVICAARQDPNDPQCEEVQKVIYEAINEASLESLEFETAARN